MFTKDELLVIEEALKIADETYMDKMNANKNNRNIMVSYNRKHYGLFKIN